VELVVEGDDGAHGIQRAWDAKWTELPEGVTVDQEGKWLNRVQPEILVVDLLEVPASLCRFFRGRSELLVVFDDLAYPCTGADIIICPQVLDSYPGQVPGQRWLTGADYFIVDDSFKRNSGPRSIRPQVETVLVVMGGCLPPEVETWTLELVDRLKEQPFQTQVVLGFDQAGAMERYRRVAGPRVSFIGGTHELGRLMWEADLAIAASGYVKLELAAAGTPALLVSVVDHQDGLGQPFAELTGAARYLGNITALAPEEVVAAALALAKDVETRRAMSEVGRRAVDGQGAERIERELLTAWHALTSRRAVRAGGQK
jgi:spore coat polysaccharide biosynthesis predicted glycosyltransferase SpsG